MIANFREKWTQRLPNRKMIANFREKWTQRLPNRNNEEPAMRNLIIDGAAGGETKRRHDVTFPLCTFFYRMFPERKHCLYRRPADFSYEKPMT
jgi:hypothetical protein